MISLIFISTGLDVVKDGIARKIGFGGVGHAALDVLDLHHGTGQVRPVSDSFSMRSVP